MYKYVCVCHIECATKHTNRYIYSRCRMYAYIHIHINTPQQIDPGAGCVNSARYNNNNKQSSIRTHPLGKIVTYIFLYIYHILHIFERYIHVYKSKRMSFCSHTAIYVCINFMQVIPICVYMRARSKASRAIW